MEGSLQLQVVLEDEDCAVFALQYLLKEAHIREKGTHAAWVLLLHQWPIPPFIERVDKAHIANVDPWKADN